MKDLRLPKVAVIWADTPKSASLTSPRSVSKILAPLISRCILPIEWRYTRPCKVSRHIKAICFSDNGPVTAKKIRVDFTKKNSEMDFFFHFWSMNQHLIYLQVPATPLPYTSYWNSTKWLLNNSYKYTGVIRVTVRKFKDFYQVLWKYFCFKNSEPYSYSKCHFLTFSIGQNWFHVKSDRISTLWDSNTPRKKILAVDILRVVIKALLLHYFWILL